MRAQSRLLALGFVTLGLALLLAAPLVVAQTPAGCASVTYADVVALDQPWLWNRYGALEPQGMMYALRRDVVPTSDVDGLPDPGVAYTLGAGQVKLRSDKRPRPLVLRVNAGDCLHIHFTNLLAPAVQSGKDEQPATRNASIHFVGLEAVKTIADMGANVGQNPAGGNGSSSAPTAASASSTGTPTWCPASTRSTISRCGRPPTSWASTSTW